MKTGLQILENIADSVSDAKPVYFAELYEDPHLIDAKTRFIQQRGQIMFGVEFPPIRWRRGHANVELRYNIKSKTGIEFDKYRVTKSIYSMDQLSANIGRIVADFSLQPEVTKKLWENKKPLDLKDVTLLGIKCENKYTCLTDLHYYDFGLFLVSKSKIQKLAKQYEKQSFGNKNGNNNGNNNIPLVNYFIKTPSAIFEFPRKEDHRGDLTHNFSCLERTLNILEIIDGRVETYAAANLSKELDYFKRLTTINQKLAEALVANKQAILNLDKRFQRN